MTFRGRHRRSGGGAEQLTLNLTPLLDVVLQLITFFMMLIHFGSRVEGEDRAVKLPVAPAALPGADLALDRLTVAVDERGRLLSGKDQAREGPAAEAWWAEQAAARRGGQETLGGPAGELPTVVVVRADGRASYGAVRRALTSAQGRGFAHFSLVVLRSRPPEPGSEARP
ncbi:MAG: biopolymer transporter ExbD [Planctomycetia bacterium]|nr:biopolymer transporter ExbD [Planctomycetia bacterium]